MPRGCAGRAGAAISATGRAPAAGASEALRVGAGEGGRLGLAETQQQFKVELRRRVAGRKLDRGGEVRDRGVDLRGATCAARRIDGEDALQRARLRGDGGVAGRRRPGQRVHRVGPGRLDLLLVGERLRKGDCPVVELKAAARGEVTSRAKDRPGEAAEARRRRPLRARGIELPNQPVLDPERLAELEKQMALVEQRITTSVDTTTVIEAKRSALAAHASQLDQSWWSRIPPELFSDVFGHETFIRAHDTTGTPVPEDDLFSGLR